MTIKNKVQLITYPDSLGGNLTTLNQLLLQHFSEVFTGGIHILPPFPSTGDRGFAPTTYLEIEPAFGTWQDIRKIGEKFDYPEDMGKICPAAFNSIYPYIRMIESGGSMPFFDEPNAHSACCPDYKRPVVFKISR